MLAASDFLESHLQNNLFAKLCGMRKISPSEYQLLPVVKFFTCPDF